MSCRRTVTLKKSRNAVTVALVNGETPRAVE
jgi:hypothetical protein